MTPRTRTKPGRSRRPRRPAASRDHERGAARPRLLGPVVLLVLIVWLATAAVPVLHTTFLFSEAIRHEVNYGPINEPAEAIRGRILTRATRLGLEVEPGDVVVERSGGKLVITAHYGVPVELAPGVAWTIELSHNQQGMRRSAVFGNS